MFDPDGVAALYASYKRDDGALRVALDPPQRDGSSACEVHVVRAGAVHAVAGGDGVGAGETVGNGRVEADGTTYCRTRGTGCTWITRWGCGTSSRRSWRGCIGSLA
jgi:hypothetical protein